MTLRVVLSTLKSSELKSIATLTGLPSSGTKSSLLESIPSGLVECSLQPNAVFAGCRAKDNLSPIRVLSVDMGIRNLAFAVLDFPTLDAVSSRVRKTPSTLDLPSRDINQLCAHLQPAISSARLIAWRRFAVAEEPSVLDSAPDVLSKAAKESFEPSALFKLAYKVVTSTFLSYRPTHILLERQRFRSGGAPAIQEWTVRVNMFECMLHAVLGTLQNEGRKNALLRQEIDGNNADLANLVLHSMSPKRIAAFWLGRDDSGKDAAKIQEDVVREKKTGVKGKVEKEHKISIVHNWLKNDTLACQGQAESVKKAFLEKRDGKSRRRTKESLDQQLSADDEARLAVTKLDDLSDCVLQGITFLQWELSKYELSRRLGF